MSELTVLFVGDLCGKPGRQAASYIIRELRRERDIDYVIANVENAAGGFGVTPEMSAKIFSYGVDLQTSGNHIWDRVQILDYLKETPKLLRPGNYPHGAPGSGVYIDEVNGAKIAVMNLMGRTYMAATDCPFRTADRELRKIHTETNVVILDFHAEATSEKQAMAFHLDGKISALVGTHTHVPTADESISRNGTAYITDVGMTGPHDSIIGMDKGPSLGRFMTGMPKRFATATDDVRLNGVLLQIDAETGKALTIERIRKDFDLGEYQSGTNDEEV